jgi:L-threonylcarbamoyladenylate synthase
MKTQYLSPHDLNVAAKLLRSDELVAFPTETVYGLAANALSADAVRKIFEAKGRPSDNPLIVHISEPSQLTSLVSYVPESAELLMKRFWPGALTLVFSKREHVHDEVTAGLETVGVRMPSHPIALELIRLAGCPLAAPSANRSGRPSATTWQAVAEDLEGRIAGIVMGDPTDFGMESTVVDVTSDPPRILRPGGVSLEALQVCCPAIEPYQSRSADPSDTKVLSPGLKHKHYQPRARVQLVSKGFEQDLPRDSLVHFIGVESPRNPEPYDVVLICEDCNEYAARLFDFFRKADLAGADFVHCQAVEPTGMGVALMDRITRAATHE